MRKRLLAMTCLSVRPSVRLVQLGCRLIFMKLHIWGFFECLSRTFRFLQNLTRITATVHDDLCSYMIIFRLILVRMRNTSHKPCIRNQNTHFLFNIFSHENVCMYVCMYIYIYIYMCVCVCVCLQTLYRKSKHAFSVQYYFPRKYIYIYIFDPLTPYGDYSRPTAPLTAKCFVLCIYSINIGTECFKHGLYSPFFSSSKFSLFRKSNVFGSCLIHILCRECAQFKEK